MTFAVLVPIHDKPVDVVRAVLRALLAQDYHQVVIVADRCPEAIQDITLEAAQGPRCVLVPIEGPPGWQSPCRAFNEGLKVITSDVTIINQSDVVQDEGALSWLRSAYQDHEAVYFGKVLESDPESLQGPGHAGPVLCSSQNPRPLTFLTAIPTRTLTHIGGWDTAFEEGACFEDDDLIARTWYTGLDFIFDDAFSATHMSHDRPYSRPMKIAPNMAHMLRKHSTLTVLKRESLMNRLTVSRVSPSRLVFRNLTNVEGVATLPPPT